MIGKHSPEQQPSFPVIGATISGVHWVVKWQCAPLSIVRWIMNALPVVVFRPEILKWDNLEKQAAEIALITFKCAVLMEQVEFSSNIYLISFCLLKSKVCNDFPLVSAYFGYPLTLKDRNMCMWCILSKVSRRILRKAGLFLTWKVFLIWSSGQMMALSSVTPRLFCERRLFCVPQF